MIKKTIKNIINMNGAIEELYVGFIKEMINRGYVNEYIGKELVELHEVMGVVI